MAVTREITCVNKRNEYNDPHERIQRVGGDYLGSPWNLPDFLVIYYIKNKIEKYFIKVNGKKIRVVVASHNGKEYLKTEIDDYSPDILLALPICTFVYRRV